MGKATITAVSYLNTLPFVYGINNTIPGKVNLSLDVPSECARKVIRGEVDFGLCPVGIFSQIAQDYQPLPYCIGADGEVSSVILFSQVPLQEITKVYLDKDSRTSVLLVRVLARNFWKITPEWVDMSVIEHVKDAESLLAIGDKAFSLKGQFPYAYDLSLEWKKMTGLPFVFAIWVGRKNASVAFRKDLEEALDFGVSHISQAIENCPEEKYRGIDLERYLNHDIQFRMCKAFQQGMDAYLKFVAEL